MKYNIGDDVLVNEGLATIVDFDNNGYKVLVNKTLEYKILQENQFKKTNIVKVPVSEEVIKEKKLNQYKRQMTNNMIKEGLRENDLVFSVIPYVSIDQYTSKINSDNITIAFFCSEKKVAEDLIDFIEKMYFVELVDIELGETITDDGKFIVYVEFERNLEFTKLLMDMIDSINYLIDKKVTDWKFQTFGMEDYLPVTEENITEKVRLTSEVEDKKEKKDKKKKVKETIEFSKNNLTRTYLDEGVITKEELDKYLSECELLNENSLDKEILEYNLPDYQVITADDKIFVISDDIRMFGVK